MVTSPPGQSRTFPAPPWGGRQLCILGSLLLLLLTGPVAAARIEVTLSHNPVPLNESFTLTFAADESPDGDPDFAPLKQDFDVLGQSQSNQFTLENGHASRRIQWEVSVVAKRAGTLPIPPIAFGSDRSEPFAVTVLPAAGGSRREAAGDDIFLEVDAEPKNPYVQAQVIYTIRVLSRVAFAGDLGKPETDDAPLERLTDDRSFMTTRDGVQYKVDERRYAIFPQKSGPFRIGPVRLEAQMQTGGRGFFGPFFGQPGRTRRIQSDAVELDVRPKPAGFSGTHWLPAANLKLTDGFDRNPPEAPAGEPLTRTLTIQAEGATVGLLPELGGSNRFPAELKRYPDQPLQKEDKSSDGIVGIRQEKVALIGTQAGTFTLPAIEIPWWNTRTDRLEIARLPERTLTVTPSAQAPVTAPAVPEPAVPPIAAASPAPAAATPGAPRALTEDPWFWAALGLGLGWGGTALAWWSRRRPAPPRAPARSAEPTADWVSAVADACRRNDAAAARGALAQWSAARRPGMTLADLAREAGGTLGEELRAMDRALYARGHAGWSGAALWQSFQAYVESARPARPVRGTPELEPLYKS